MKEYKYFLIAMASVIIMGFAGLSYEQYLKSQEKQTQLEIKKLELLIKLKEK